MYWTVMLKTLKQLKYKHEKLLCGWMQQIVPTYTRSSIASFLHVVHPYLPNLSTVLTSVKYVGCLQDTSAYCISYHTCLCTFRLYIYILYIYVLLMFNFGKFKQTEYAASHYIRQFSSLSLGWKLITFSYA